MNYSISTPHESRTCLALHTVSPPTSSKIATSISTGRANTLEVVVVVANQRTWAALSNFVTWALTKFALAYPTRLGVPLYVLKSSGSFTAHMGLAMIH